VISYEKLKEGDAETVAILQKALLKKGIVGLCDVPGYKECYRTFLQSAIHFHGMKKEVKESYSPDREKGHILGYEMGAKKFKRKDGTWVEDNLKTSYYARVPNTPENIWPEEMDIQAPFIQMGSLMKDTGRMIMHAAGLIGENSSLESDTTRHLGRMLYYKKSSIDQNRQWSGEHFDHEMFTALIPAAYFVKGKRVAEPAEAGLYVRLSKDDEMIATEHYVNKAYGEIERYTKALFFEPSFETRVNSKSILTEEARYLANKEGICAYEDWSEATYKRYLAGQK
jgi:isopenicillin N synthase-like dioxygenase